MKKKLEKKQAKRRNRTKPPELYFVIGGGVDRTKCPTEGDAVEHAKKLLRERAEPGTKAHYALKINRLPTFQEMHSMSRRSLIETMSASNPDVPELERRQCLRSTKPLYIVKVVGVVEMKPAPIVVRTPKGDELPDKPATE